MDQTAAVTPERIMQMAWGYAPPLTIEAAIRHGVFDTLDGGPRRWPKWRRRQEPLSAA